MIKLSRLSHYINLLTTTKIELYPWANGSFVIKSANIYIQGFFGIEFGINFPVGCSVQFLLHWQASYLSTYCFISFVTPGHQKFLVINSTVFHCLLWSPTSISWCSLIISALNLLSFGIYTFPSLYIMPSTSLHSLSLNIFTSAYFISFMAFTTSSFFTFNFLTSSSRSTLSTIISTTSVLLTPYYSIFTNISFSLSLSTSIS